MGPKIDLHTQVRSNKAQIELLQCGWRRVVIKLSVNQPKNLFSFATKLMSEMCSDHVRSFVE